jgi:hypothetical protein
MENIQTFTAFTITANNKSDFDTVSYSQFKYGCTTHGIRFAKKLFDVFDQNLFDSKKDYIVYSSPYQSIPTATYCMAREFFELLKERMQPYGRKVKFEKLFRDPTYTVDYGTLTREDRLKLIGQDTFSFIKTPKEDFTLIFLDDVKVTGSHEHVLKNSIKKLDIQNPLILGYYAIVHPELPAKYEHDINEAAISGIEDLVQIGQQVDFEFNTRVVKRLLISEPHDFDYVLTSLKNDQLRSMRKLAESNGYHNIEAYQTNYEKLLHFVQKHVVR